MIRLIGTVTLAYMAFVTVACLALQNIRIQVNNENLQNPPYLLEALKQASAQESASQGQQQSGAIASGEPAASLAGTRLQASAVAQDLGRRENEATQAATHKDEKLSVIKEEAIEELLGLEPESVLRLSPDGLINSESSSQEFSSGYAAESHQTGQSVVDKAQAPTTSHEPRKPELPVTSSHLKRPVVSADQLDELPRPSADTKPSESESRTNLNASELGASGAKSRVSPSVALEDGPAVDLNKKRGAALQPPDTWPANQVMHGVTNTSLVPATVRRQYGHQTRTRITLGGGYERDKLPALIDPSSSDYRDNAPEKPLAPLERPLAHREDQDQAESSNVDSASDYEQSGLIENSRLVEVPKRIVLPVSVFNQDNEQTAKPRPANATRRRDSRCPANGVTSLEHPTACDKYFLCQDGQLSEHTCPNGLMYGTRDVVRDFCVHRWEAVCGDKSIPNPISSPGCRWQNGIFTVQGSPKCVPDFYECKDGQFEVRKCSIGGQVYDDKTKSCRYAEQVGCTQEALADFRCPPDDQTNTYWPFPRYFLNERALIHCINDKPEIIRCRDHERVDTEHLFCVPINKSEAPSSDESGGAPEITARRSTSASQQREKAAKSPSDSQTQADGAIAIN